MPLSFRPISLSDCRDALANEGPDHLWNMVFDRLSAEGLNAVTEINDTASPGTSERPLSGLPFAVKDNIVVDGFATRGASPALNGYRPTKEATVVTALKRAGGHVVAKLNMHELAFGVISNNPTFGTIASPLVPDRIAGGSSGGSAAAVAVGAVPFALGTDTGGSTRIPAACCGIAGFRPSTGRYAGDGVLTLSNTRDTIGPMASNCRDLAEIDAIVTGETTLPALEKRPKLGVAWTPLGWSKSVDAGFQTILDKIAADVDLVPVELAGFDTADADIGFPIVFCEAFDLWVEFAQNQLGLSYDAFAARIASPDVRRTFEALPERAEAHRDMYRTIQNEALPKLRQYYLAALDAHGLDAVIMPTLPVQPPRLSEFETMDTDAGPRPTFPTLVRNTAFATLTGAPSVAIPAGTDPDGLPLSIMLDGRPNADRAVLSLAILLENVLGT